MDACVKIFELQAISHETEIAKDVQVIETLGHTQGSISVLVDTADSTVAVVGDLISRVKEDSLSKKPPFWEPKKGNHIEELGKNRQTKTRTDHTWP